MYDYNLLTSVPFEEFAKSTVKDLKTRLAPGERLRVCFVWYVKSGRLRSLNVVIGLTSLLMVTSSSVAHASHANWHLNGSTWPDRGGCGGRSGIEYYKYQGNDHELANVHLTICSDPAQRNGDHITWEGNPRYAFYGYTHQYTGNPPHNIVDILNRGWLDWRSPP
jgi:hypothetical protein